MAVDRFQSGCRSIYNLFGIPMDRQDDRADVVLETTGATDESVDSVERAADTVYVKADIGCDAADPAYEHPFDMRSATAFNIVPEIHAGLFTHSPDGAQVVPELAESYSASEDFKSYEFVLREGLKFSDGSPLTGADVKWSWERALSRFAGGSRAVDVFGSVQGTESYVRNGVELIGVRVLDERRIAVDLTVPRPDFLSLLADPVAAILKSENVGVWPTEWDNSAGMSDSEKPFLRSNMPVGAGPFKLVEYSPDLPITRCTLERNEHYWDGVASLDRIVAVTRSMDRVSSIQPWDDREALAAGVVDYYLVGLSSRRDAGPEDDFGEPLIVAEPPRTWFVIFNPSHAPFDRVEFRRLLVAMSDVEEIFPNADATASRLVPPSLFALGSAFVAPRHEVPVSVESSDGESFSLYVPVGGFGRMILGPLFDQWNEKLGLDARFSRRSDRPETNPLMPLRLVTLSPAYRDPHAVLRAFIDPFGPENESSELEEISAMVREAAAETDASERERRYIEIERLILERALALPLRLDEYEFEFRVRPSLDGLVFPQYGGSVFQGVKLEESNSSR